MADYFLLAVSTRENLDLCRRYSLAGFPSTVNGAWAFCDVAQGDFVSFLYGAKAHGLYRIARKRALQSRDGQVLPPWPVLVFRTTKLRIDFPFRLELESVRSFDEPLIRPEFSYVAENLLQRGGYWKTHFQADQTTLQLVSKFGQPQRGTGEPISYPDLEEFTPQFSSLKRSAPPRQFRFQELILQAAIRRKLQDVTALAAFIGRSRLDGNFSAGAEILGEKAIEEGPIDLLIQEVHPQGSNRRIAVEVKSGTPTRKDVQQLARYVQLLGGDCIGGILVSGSAPSRRISRPPNLGFLQWSFDDLDLTRPAQFEALVKNLVLEPC